MTSPGHLLLIDDDRTFSRLLAMWLERDGWIVESAHDHESAIAAGTSGVVFDALIADYELGRGVTGLSVAEAISSSAPSIKTVVIISGHREEVVRANPSTVTYHFFQKPFPIDQLALCLRTGG